MHAHSTQAGELCLTLCYARQRRQPQPPAPATASAAAAEEAWRSAAEEFRRRVCSAQPAAGTTAAASPAGRGVAAGGGVRACSVVGSWRKHTLVVGTEHMEEVFHLRADPAAGACISPGEGEVTTVQGATTAEPGAAGTAGAMVRCVRYHLRDGVWRPQSGTG
eukprot:COSAG01_NODE_7938_length_2984_cov_1.493588_4_plen_163_part_00